MTENLTHPNDRIAMALHLSRGFESAAGVEQACRFVGLGTVDTREVLELRGFADPHPGRECSPDCAEYGCASWTAIDAAVLARRGLGLDKDRDRTYTWNRTSRAGG
jgi:hypothetical protein